MAPVEVQHFINGEVRTPITLGALVANRPQFVPSSDGKTFDLLSPYSDDTVAKG